MALFGLDRLRSIGPLAGQAPPVAIDFGTQSLKILQLGAGDPPTLVGAAVARVPDAVVGDANKRLAWQLEELPRLMKAADLRAKRAVAALPSSQTFCKHVQVAPAEGVPLASLVALEVAQQLHCDPTSVMCRHVEVVGATAPGGAGKAEVIALAASRSLVMRIMGAIKACRMEPVGIHPEPLALLRGFDQITRRDADAALTSLYLDLGAGTTKVIIAHGTQLVFCKTIALGGRVLDQLVAQQAKCGAEDAHAMRQAMAQMSPKVAGAPAAPAAPAASMAGREERAGGAGARARTGIPALDAQLAAVEEPVAATAVAEERRGGGGPPGAADDVGRPVVRAAPPTLDLSEPLDALTEEISLCLRYYEGLFPGRRVNRTIFVGGEAGHVGLCQHIARSLRMPAHVADPLARVARTGKEPCLGARLSGSQPGWAVAMGLSVGPTDL